MKLSILLFLAALAACATERPFLSHVAGSDPPPLAEQAQEMVADMLEQSGLERPDANVRWVSELIPSPRGDKEGRAYGCEVAVYWDGVSSVGETVLAHEMTHCAHWLTFGLDGESENFQHSNEWVWGEVLPPVRAALFLFSRN
jgi:hypothetical protein